MIYTIENVLILYQHYTVVHNFVVGTYVHLVNNEFIKLTKYNTITVTYVIKVKIP